MESILTTLLIVVGILLIISIMMQPSKQQDALSALSGGGGELFAQQKARGFEAIMKRATTVLGGAWLLIGFALMYVSSR